MRHLISVATIQAVTVTVTCKQVNFPHVVSSVFAGIDLQLAFLQLQS